MNTKACTRNMKSSALIAALTLSIHWTTEAGATTTRKGRTVFVHVTKWPESGKIQLPPVDAELLRTGLMNDGKARAIQSANGVEISVAPDLRDSAVTTVALTFDRDMMDLSSGGLRESTTR